VVPEIESAAAVREPTHDEFVTTDDLLTINTKILPPCVGSACDDEPPRQKGRDVAWPARLNGKFVQIDIVTFPDDILTRCALDVFGTHIPQRGLEHRDFGEGVFKAFRRFGFA